MVEYTPKGNKYNSEDPLGLIQKERELEKRLTEPNPIQRFIEAEALKKDKARQLRAIIRPLYKELTEEFNEIIQKLMGMVVTIETQIGYIKGRIKSIGNGMVCIEQRGNKKEMWVDFDECIDLSNNYK